MLNKRKVKLWIAEKYLNKLGKGYRYCWADLVLWALGYQKLADCSKAGSACLKDIYTYCGKCAELFPKIFTKKGLRREVKA